MKKIPISLLCFSLQDPQRVHSELSGQAAGHPAEGGAYGQVEGPPHRPSGGHEGYGGRGEFRPAASLTRRGDKLKPGHFLFFKSYFLFYIFLSIFFQL